MKNFPLEVLLEIASIAENGITILNLPEERLSMIVLSEFEKKYLKEFIFEKKEKVLLFKFKKNNFESFRIKQIKEDETYINNSKYLYILDLDELYDMDLDTENLEIKTILNNKNSFNYLF